VGATIVRQTVDEVGRAPLLAVLVIPMVLLGAIALAVNRHAERMGAPRAERLGASGDGHAVWEGARLVVQSRYFAGVAALILLYELVSNIVDFQLAASVQLAIDGTTERDAFFGLVGQISGVLSIVVQLLLTSWVMRRYGLGVALLFLPLAIGMGTVGYMAIGGLVYAAGMSVSDSALSYSIHQSAKEALYVAGRRQEKYKAKAFIDMFVQRAAKVLAVGLNLVVASYVGLANVQWLGLVTFGALAAWIPLVLYLGRQFENRPVREPAVAPMRRRVSLAPSGAPAG
jgi:AAA family ATP:ADP antiporter